MEDSLKNLPPFYVGQKVVYITGENMPKDSIHTVLGIKYEFCCGAPYLEIKNKSEEEDFNHDGTTHVQMDCCGKVISLKMYNRLSLKGCWNINSFRPLQESVFPSLTLSRVIEKERQLVSMN